MMSKRLLPPGWTEAKFGKIATFKNGANFGASDRGFELKMLGVGDFADSKEFDHRFRGIRPLIVACGKGMCSCGARWSI